MDALIWAAGILLVGAITPGPNNLVVMTAGARGGIGGALPALAGIILGTLAMSAVVVLGAGVAFAAEPRIRTAITAAGCLYLGWLGLRLFTTGDAQAMATLPSETHLPSHAAGLFFFQFLNPKAWAMVLTVTSGVHSGIGATRIGLLVALIVLIPAVCLALWAWLGSLMTRRLTHTREGKWFQRSMGALLVVSALLLWFTP
jgi:threonine/homoserine/homoserine lactone efflux protein